MDYRMELLQSMFPTLTASSIEDVLHSKAGSIEAAIDDLLALSLTIQSVKPAKDGERDQAAPSNEEDHKTVQKKEADSEERELAMWMERNKTREEELAKLESEAAKLQEMLQQIQPSDSTLSDLSDSVDNSEHTTDRLLDTNYLSKIRSTLEVSELTKLGDELIMQQSELFRLKQELQEMDQLLAEKDKVIQDKDAEIAQLSEKHLELVARESDRTTQVEQLTGRLHEMSGHCSELNAKLRDQDMELAAVKEENVQLTSRVAELEATTASLKVRLEAAQYIASKLSEQNTNEKDQLLALKEKLQEGLHFIRDEAKKAIEEEHVKKLLEGINKAANILVEGSKNAFSSAKNEIDNWHVLDKVSEVGDALKKIVSPREDLIEKEFQEQLQRAIEESKKEMEILQAASEESAK